MNLDEILKEAGHHKRRKRVGRGEGSGRGKTCTRGHKGVGARAGGGPNPLSEGGQMQLFRRLPKRGFNNANFRTEYSVVNLYDLEENFEAGAHVTPLTLVEAGLVRNLKRPVKILATGAFSKKMIVEAGKFSQKAAEKIQAAGGQAKVVGKAEA